MEEGSIWISFLFGILFALVVLAAVALKDGIPKDPSFTERCKMDNGVVIQAQKMFCVKQSSLVDEK